MHAKRELIDTITDGDADTDNRREDCGGVDYRADASRGFGAEHCSKRGPDGEWHIPAVGKVSERHADDRVAAPWRQTIVEEGPFIGCREVVALQCRGGAHNHVGIIGKVCEGLGGGVGQHADPDTGTKHHREPGEAAEFWPFVISAQTNAASAGHQRKHQTHHHKDGRGVHIPAAEIADRARLDVHQNRAGVTGERCPQHKADNDDLNGNRHPAVLAGIEPGAINPGDGLWH